jgi:outer membrane immunogenic protein
MKNELLVGALLAAISGSAMAADLPTQPGPAPAPVYSRPLAMTGYNWSGLYLGVNGGGGWGTSRFDFPGTATTTGSFKTSGGLIGGTLGASFQMSFVVFGFEGDLDWAKIGGSAPCPAPVPGSSCQSTDFWLGTGRARLGVAFHEWLFYGTAGGAFGDVRISVVPGFPGQDVIRLGWAAGAGIEYGFSQSASVKAEYLHVDLGASQCAPGNCTPGAVATVNVPYTADIFRAGLNYRFGFGGPLVSRY